MSFSLSLFGHKTDTKPKEVLQTWTQMCVQFEHPVVRDVKDGALFSPAVFRPAYRLQENVITLSLLVLDYDHHASFDADLAPWRALGCCFAAYTTHSHRRIIKSNPEAEERFRVVVPLAAPIPVEKFPALWQWAARLSGGKIDPQAQDASRMYYSPAIASHDAPYRFAIVDGEPLDWRTLDYSLKTDAPATQLSSVSVANEFNSWDELHAEAVRCIRQLPKARTSYKGWTHAPGICHGSMDGTAVYVSPDATRHFPEGVYGCHKGCDRARIRITLGLPKRPNTDDPETEQWDLPAAFYEYDLPDFPIMALPVWLREFVQGLARETQTPVDLAALLTLSVCAGTFAGKVRVQARRGWIEPLNLYNVTAMPPANRKSAVFAAACEPLEERERDLVEEKRDEIAQAESEYRMLEERRNRLEKEAARNDDPDERKTKRDEAIKLAQELASLKVPALPRLICADVTPERLASLLAEQDGRMCLFSPEGDLFDMLAGRYTGGAPNFDVILKGHSGDALRVDRRGRSEHVQHPALTIGLTVQPDVIRGLVDKPGFRGRGLIGRFLYSIPKSKIGCRLIDPEPLSNEVRQTYKNNIKALSQIEHTSDYEGFPVARMLYLTAEANALLKQFEAELEPQLAEDGELGTMADWAGKLAGAVVRIASILHLATHAQELAHWPERVAAETMSHAITIGRYLIPHAKAAYAEMGADIQVENAKHVLRWIERTERRSFTKRDSHQALRARFKKVTDIEPALELLEAHGYIRTRTDDTDRRPGRKSSQIFDVNPLLFSQSHNTQNPQNLSTEVNSEDSEYCEDKSTGNLFKASSLEKPILQENITERERLRI